MSQKMAEDVLSPPIADDAALKFVVLIMAAALIYNSAMKTGMFGDYRITAKTIAVKNIKIIVFIAPIFWPTLIITRISVAGTAIINKNSVFICRITNYINSIYLSNNE